MIYTKLDARFVAPPPLLSNCAQNAL